MSDLFQNDIFVGVVASTIVLVLWLVVIPKNIARFGGWLYDAIPAPLKPLVDILLPTLEVFSKSAWSILDTQVEAYLKETPDPYDEVRWRELSDNMKQALDKIDGIEQTLNDQS